jgi:hypothetical protein
MSVKSGVVKVHDQGANPHISFDALTLSKGSPDQPAMGCQKSRTWTHFCPLMRSLPLMTLTVRG